jgi:hypothetical protein
MCSRYIKSHTPEELVYIAFKYNRFLLRISRFICTLVILKPIFRGLLNKIFNIIRLPNKRPYRVEQTAFTVGMAACHSGTHSRGLGSVNVAYTLSMLSVLSHRPMCCSLYRVMLDNVTNLHIFNVLYLLNL